MPEFLKRSWQSAKSILLLGITFSLSYFLTYMILKYRDLKFSQIEDFIDVFANVFIVVGAIIAFWQYLAYQDANMSEKRRVRALQAIELAGYYKDKILEDITHIITINKDIGIWEILAKNIRLEQMRDFDMEEMTKLLGDNYDCINEKIKSKDFSKTLAKSSFIYGFSVESQTGRKVTHTENAEEISVSFDLLSLRREYSLLVSRTLNALEYFAMHFTHNTADESVIYQSLHQSYLQITQCLYYEIAKNNKNTIGEGKYYTNLVELFRIWRDRTIEKRERDIKMTRETTKGTVAH